jgi:hypothetical protein
LTRKASWQEVKKGLASGDGPVITATTRCVSVDDFIQRFYRFVDENTLAIPVTTRHGAGDVSPFQVTLKDRTPVFSGRCRVLEVRPDKGGGPGKDILRLKLIDLDPPSRAVHKAMLARRNAPALASSPAKPGKFPLRFDAERTVVPTGEEEARHAAARAKRPSAHPVPPPPVTRASGTRPIPRPALVPTPRPPQPVMPEEARRKETARPPAAPVTARPPPPGFLATRPVVPAPHVDKRDELADLVACTLEEEDDDEAIWEESTRRSARGLQASLVAETRPAGAPSPDKLGYSPSPDKQGHSPSPHNQGHSPSPDKHGHSPGAGPAAPPPFAALPTATPFAPSSSFNLAASSAPVRPGDYTDTEPPVLARPRRSRYWTLGLPVVALAAVVAFLVKDRTMDTPAEVGIPALATASKPEVPGVVPAAAAPTDEATGEAPVEAPVAEPARPGGEPASEPPAAAPREATKEAIEDAPDLVAATAPARETGAGEAREKEEGLAPETETPEPTDVAADGPCFVEVVSRPEGARVMWGPHALGTTPVRRTQVPCGPARVTFDRVRYEPLQKDLAATQGTTTTVNEKLVRPTARLRIASSPAGATVRINNRPAGKTPRTLTVSRFETVRVIATMPGHRAWKGSLYVKDGEASIEAALVPVR